MRFITFILIKLSYLLTYTFYYKITSYKALRVQVELSLDYYFLYTHIAKLLLNLSHSRPISLRKDILRPFKWFMPSVRPCGTAKPFVNNRNNGAKTFSHTMCERPTIKYDINRCTQQATNRQLIIYIGYSVKFNYRNWTKRLVNTIVNLYVVEIDDWRRVYES